MLWIQEDRTIPANGLGVTLSKDPADLLGEQHVSRMGFPMHLHVTGIAAAIKFIIYIHSLHDSVLLVNVCSR